VIAWHYTQLFTCCKRNIRNIVVGVSLAPCVVQAYSGVALQCAAASLHVSSSFSTRRSAEARRFSAHSAAGTAVRFLLFRCIALIARSWSYRCVSWALRASAIQIRHWRAERRSLPIYSGWGLTISVVWRYARTAMASIHRACRRMVARRMSVWAQWRCASTHLCRDLAANNRSPLRDYRIQRRPGGRPPSPSRAGMVRSYTPAGCIGTRPDPPSGRQTRCTHHL